ncbi:hypothetical protein K2173_027359 [Erythroxylum novogranatense]|uniref:RING-type E3 ubiquitin transferase n=1 Tax=Erythroxylum novogranatense TaxID=1862640 RepID=A0AAV8TYV3_9ROSI|nr:hypothetical protein K2173_027359 [Erythroxylum novogranatense]
MANIPYLPHHLRHRDAGDDSQQRRRRYVGPFLPSFSSSRSPRAPFSNYRQAQLSNLNTGEISEDEHDGAAMDPDSVFLNDRDLLERENQVSFVMDLFQQHVEQSHLISSELGSLFGSDSMNELGFGVIENSCESGMDDLGLDMGLGFGLDSHSNCGFQNIEHLNNNDDDDYGLNVVIDDDDDFFVERRVSGVKSREAESAVRVVGFESDSDSEQDGVENSLGIDFRSGDEYGLDHFGDYDNNDDEEDNDASVNIPLCWDSLQLDDRRENNEDFEWEELDGRVESLFVDDEEASISLSIAPVIEPEDLVNLERAGGSRNLEWQVLLNSQNWETNVEQELDHNVEPSLGDLDDHHYTAEYEMPFGNFAEDEIALMGRPPAAKSVVERLVTVVLTKADKDSNNTLCAVCKDEINIGERAKQLPCTHRYHGECILPWLGIRNTCPVCRYELPTDDADYERRKAAQ